MLQSAVITDQMHVHGLIQIIIWI